MRRHRGLSPEDLALWHHAVRDAEPLRPEVTDRPVVSVVTVVPPPQVPAPKVAQAVAAGPPVPPRARRLDPTGPVDLDRRSWLKLRRGSYPIDARLDLHGLTQAEAHDRLTAFLAVAQAKGNRCVLVITGRGLRTGGTLREATPRWLETQPNRDRVLSFTRAQIHHGGDGALYVLLRRR